MASLSLLKNWLDDALLPYVRQDMAHAAVTLEPYVALWPEDALGRAARVSAWLHLLEESSAEEAAHLHEKLRAERDFVLAPEEPAGWLSAWNRARFLHLCRARPAVEAPRSRLALFAALRDVDVTLGFSPFDLWAQSTRARVLRGLGHEQEAFRVVRAVETWMPRFTGLDDLRGDPAYAGWRERLTAPVEPIAHEPSIPPAVAATLRPREGEDLWLRARDAALSALAVELERGPGALTLTHPAQVEPWRGRFLTFGREVALSHHTLTLLRHWWVVAGNHPRLRGGPRRWLFPQWDTLAPMTPEEVEARFTLDAFPGEPGPAHDTSGAVFGIQSTGNTSRIHAALPEAGAAEREEDALCHSSADLEAVLRRLATGRLSHLKLHGAVGLEGLSRVARAPGAEHLRSLHLPLCDVGPEGARMLASAPAFAGLRELVLDGNPLGPEGLAALVEGPGARELRALSLVGCQLGPEGARRLGRSALVRQLLVLDVGSNALGDGLRDWASREGPWALEVLGLGYNAAPTGAALAAWLRGPLAGRLRWLDAAHGSDGDALAEAVAESPHLERLAVLDVGWSGLSAAGVERLAQAAPRALVWLGLGGNRLGASGSAALARAPLLRAVTHLGLSATDADPEPLLASEHLGRLVFLDLGDNGLPASLGERFRASPRLPRLERLVLRTTEYA
ncbi:hypothetical protein P2318_02185 [Myxococcaceae bacterium GXIMD 01537]